MFLDISIGYPGSASDYLAFITSSLNAKLETNGFLAPNLVLFGDNACVSNSCMVVPCKNISSGSEDTFNFFYSQVRIKVESSFSMLAHRWAILCRSMPANMSLSRVTTLTCCLHKLHNFHIDERKADHYEQTHLDSFYSSISSSFPVAADDDSNMIPTEVLHSGEHSSDFN